MLVKYRSVEDAKADGWVVVDSFNDAYIMERRRGLNDVDVMLWRPGVDDK